MNSPTTAVLQAVRYPLSLLIVICLPQTAKGADPAESETAATLAQNARPSILRVEQWSAAPEKTRRHLGTGFFIAEQDPEHDWILTVLPEVSPADTFQVEVGRNMTAARLVARDPDLWLTLLSVPAQADQPALTWAAKSPQEGGTTIFSLDAGSPTGEPAGVGKFACREAPGSMLPSLLRLNLTPHDGAAGAPIFDSETKVAGILLRPVANAAPGAFLAIPSEAAMKFAGDLQRFGRAARAWAGIYVDESVHAPVIVGVTPGGPGAAADFQAGDVILQINGTAISSLQDVIDAFSLLVPDIPVGIRVLRGTELKTLNLTPRIRQRREV